MMRPMLHNDVGGQRPKKTAILLAQRIVREITQNDLQPGMMLPPQHKMLESYKVGRATLREALRYLELQGVLEIRSGPGGGPMVVPPTAKPLASTFALLLDMERTPFRDIVDARAVIEPLLAAQAAQHATPDTLEAIGEACERMDDNLDRLDVFLEANHHFHQLVAAASGNRVFDYLWASLAWIIDGTPVGVDYPFEQRQAVARAHREILDALRAADAAGAAAAMGAHLGEYSTYVSRRYPEILDRKLSWGAHYM